MEPSRDAGPDPKPLAIACVALCNASYLDASTICSYVSNVNNVPPIDPGEKWQCVWGPAEDDPNLVYVATCGDASEPPAFVAVVIRGTDLSVDLCGIIEQIIEDFDVVKLEHLPWAKSASMEVAQGTLDGLESIEGLVDKNTGQTLLQFLTELFGDQANANPQLIVTGHSPGGCLTTVVAPWLKAKLPPLGKPTIPVTFASPTAGNPDFATHFSSSFQTSFRYVNTLDSVPCAWAKLETIPKIYNNDPIPPPERIPAPWYVTKPIGIVADYLSWKGYQYAQPQLGRCPLTGVFDVSRTEWVEQAEHQHRVTTYVKLLGRKPIAGEVSVSAAASDV